MPFRTAVTALERLPYLWFVVVLILGLTLAACTPTAINDDNGNDDTVELPAEVEAWLQNARQIFAGQVFHHDGQTYILASYGQLSTTGYGVEITNVTVGEEAVQVSVTMTAPTEGEAVYTLVSYPYDLHVIEETALPVEFAADGATTLLPTVDLDEELAHIVAASPRIVVFAPAPGSGLSDEIALRGLSYTFESEVRWELWGATGMLTDGIVLGGTVDAWSLFEETIPVPETQETQLRLRLYESGVAALEPAVMHPIDIMLSVE